jgi:hypothetical protein
MPAATRRLLYLFRDRTTHAKGGPGTRAALATQSESVRYFSSFGSVFT